MKAMRNSYALVGRLRSGAGRHKVAARTLSQEPAIAEQLEDMEEAPEYDEEEEFNLYWTHDWCTRCGSPLHDWERFEDYCSFECALESGNLRAQLIETRERLEVIHEAYKARYHK